MRKTFAYAVALALPACGGGGAGPTRPVATPTPPLVSLSDLTAQATSPIHNTNVNCQEEFRVTVGITNNSQTSVSVRGITREEGRVVDGFCGGGDPFTFDPFRTTAPPGTTVVLEDRLNFSCGCTGCCNATCRGDFCVFHYDFVVSTSLGDVPAGTVAYGVNFVDCIPCSAPATALDARDSPACDR